MALFYDQVMADAVGSVINTKEEIGTVTLNGVASKILGIILQDVLTAVPATAKSNLGKFHISSDDANINKFSHDGGLAAQGGTATNQGGKQTRSQFISMDQEVSPKADITFEYEQDGISVDADIAAQAFVVYSDGKVPADIIEALWKRYLPYPVRQSKVSNMAAMGTTNLSKSYDDVLTFEGKYKELISYKCKALEHALATDGEHVLGFNDLFKTGTIDLGPVKLPVPAISAELGAQVDMPTRWAEEWPLYVLKGSGKENFTPEMTLQQITTGAYTSSITINAR